MNSNLPIEIDNVLNEAEHLLIWEYFPLVGTTVALYILG